MTVARMGCPGESGEESWRKPSAGRQGGGADGHLSQSQGPEPLTKAVVLDERRGSWLLSRLTDRRSASLCTQLGKPARGSGRGWAAVHGFTHQPLQEARGSGQTGLLDGGGGGRLAARDGGRLPDGTSSCPPPARLCGPKREGKAGAEGNGDVGSAAMRVPGPEPQFPLLSARGSASSRVSCRVYHDEKTREQPCLGGWRAEARTTHVTHPPTHTKGQVRRGPRWTGFSSPADEGTKPSQGKFSVTVRWPLRCFLGS